MTSKQKRIGKVIVHREKELDRKVGELGKARAEAELKESAVSRERSQLERAAAEREAMSERAMSASEWREANEWLQSRAKSHEVATHALERANQQVQASQGHVLTARRALKGVEIYEGRLRAEVVKAEDKADQKLQDELARARSATKREKS
jgi:flagellar export protein FliJ